MYNLVPIPLNKVPSKQEQELAIPIVNNVPKEMDVFYQTEATFLPEGKTFAQLTKEESDLVRTKYRFAYMVPGLYQQITWRGAPPS